MKQGNSTSTIFHADLDAFYVEVERQYDHSLIGKPVIVGGMGPRGVVATASYEAREFGVQSAQPTTIARKLCPQGCFLPGNHSLYSEVSKQFMNILRQYSPTVLSVSIDEAYLDMSGTKEIYGPPIVAAETIRQKIRDSIGLPVSIGIGPNKLIAKVCTEYAKPDGIFQIEQIGAERFFAPQPVRNLPGIGPKAEKALNNLKIFTLGELAMAPDGLLRRALGPNRAGHIKSRAKGIDNTPLQEPGRAKSMSAETTFDEDISSQSEMEVALKKLIDRVGTRLRKSGQVARGVSIKLRYRDFATITRQHTLTTPSDGDQTIYQTAQALLLTAMRERNESIRLIGISVTGLDQRATQLSLLDSHSKTDSDTSLALDAIREKFGFESISRGTQ
ncbi:DNA polymerase IV [SAR202 cluster bacterium AD-802-L14_MRT_200m]|nr:DNA polymerase IV [SAR202 cluster bacterium AD-802-L14_MRT_200m]